MGNAITIHNAPPSSSLSLASVPDLVIFEILKHLDFTDRGLYSQTSKHISYLLKSDASFLWRLNRLHIEKGIYFPPTRLTSYREMFFELWPRRDLWIAPQPETKDKNNEEEDLPLWRLPPKPSTTENFNIRVCARFKPSDNTDEEDEPNKKAITLPLHQRIQLIKLSKRLTSNKQALNVLKSEGAWFGDEWKRIEEEEAKNNPGDNKENATPMSPGSKNGSVQQLRDGVHSIDAMNGRVVMVDPTKGLREYEFDNVLREQCSQNAVYESSTRRLVADFVNGFNGTCLVYGQTGSGKTYTMFGPDENAIFGSEVDSRNKKMRGVVPRVCSEVLHALTFRESKLNSKFTSTLSVSYVEIYGDEVTDLLKKGTQCGHSKVASQRFVLSGAAENVVHSIDDINKMLQIGEGEKRRAATAMNQRSSRAHSLFVLTLNQKCEESGVSCESRLFLADLGGSEQVKKSKVNVGTSNHIEALKNATMGGKMGEINGTAVEDGSQPPLNLASSTFSTGFKQSDRMREAVYINLGLLALKKCVEALNNAGEGSSKSQYVPYSDSKLTMLLSSGLGGDAKCTVVVCATKERKHSSETTAALRFGEACRKIEKAARSGATMLAELIAKIDEEIEATEANIIKNERWEVKEEHRVDELAEEGTLEAQGFGGKEVKKVTVLVGAEEDRLALMALLKKRAELTGTTLESDIGGGKFGGGVGFGQADSYGLGEKHDDEGIAENYRFKDAIDVGDVPSSMKVKGKVVEGWNNKEEDKGKLEKMAKKKNRTRMAYAGIST